MREDMGMKVGRGSGDVEVRILDIAKRERKGDWRKEKSLVMEVREMTGKVIGLEITKEKMHERRLEKSHDHV